MIGMMDDKYLLPPDDVVLNISYGLKLGEVSKHAKEINRHLGEVDRIVSLSDKYPIKDEDKEELEKIKSGVWKLIVLSTAVLSMAEDLSNKLAAPMWVD